MGELITAGSGEGTVVWFDDKLGAGFIRTSEGHLVYVHYKDIESIGHRRLTPGESVEFDVTKDGEDYRLRRVKYTPIIRPWRYINSGVVRSFVYKCLRRCCVRFMWVIRGGRPSINMVRYYILKTKFFEVYIHQFMDADDYIFHDHPWNFLTLILAGKYLEEQPSGRTRWLRAGRLVFRRSSFRHRVDVPDELRGRVWTLVIAGKRTRKWSFFDKQQNQLSPGQYGELRGAELRTNNDFQIPAGFFPCLKSGTKRPELMGHGETK